jgi:Cof subfamily protein (haloacid dehalogenase superfamily)
LKYKLIVTDLDDTLLRNDRTISERSKQTIARAREKGIIVALATGRMYPSAAPYARELGLTGPMPCCQGAEIADIETGRPIKITGIPRELAGEALRFIESKGLYAQYYSIDDYFFERESEESEYYRVMAGVQGKPTGMQLSAAVDFDPIKILVISEPALIRRTYEEASEYFAGKLCIAISKSRYLEITHPRANKGAAVEELAAMHKVRREQVMALGDALNDLPMLQYAGLGVAVANGDEQVKAQADALTASNESDGVAEAIEKYALGE